MIFIFRIYAQITVAGTRQKACHSRFEVVMRERDKDIYTDGDHDVTLYFDHKKITHGLANSP